LIDQTNLLALNTKSATNGNRNGLSLNPTKSGELVARKVIPKDARAEYKRLHGVGREAILKIPAGTPKAQAKALRLIVG
jgi:hypothetical protein